MSHFSDFVIRITINTYLGKISIFQFFFNVDFIPLSNSSRLLRRERSRSRDRFVSSDFQIELSKMGELVSETMLTLLRGSRRDAEKFFNGRRKINVDQRTKVEHCVSALRKIKEDEIVIFGVESKSDLESFCAYFKEKDRLGFVNEEGGMLYFVPVCRQFLDPLDLSPRTVSAAGSLIAILVPK